MERPGEREGGSAHASQPAWLITYRGVPQAPIAVVGYSLISIARVIGVSTACLKGFTTVYNKGLHSAYGVGVSVSVYVCVGKE